LSSTGGMQKPVLLHAIYVIRTTIGAAKDVNALDF
jgi:hypothetical protein